ncbi:Carbonyl reductase [NADPH] 1 [Seminavis robusta]|uniref:Carbonyl reductase [NADPH] 1 n=1 Tax=Seminavis robusta TaxID=568900 RepID=A0A9N8DBB9_9STRA|nr:Carbonyl reductase [NADPH] 1 [Seminavis robusta]|eukprot:Sro43_g026370.1 Carbonyl reductase [NADPH] 1 (329) ;mRNA; f:135403-136470
MMAPKRYPPRNPSWSMRREHLMCFLGLSLLLSSRGCLALAAASSKPRVALVSGSNKGIGREIVRLLANDEQDWVIFLGSRDESRGNQAVQDLMKDLDEKNQKTSIVCCPLDLTDPTSIARAKEMVEQQQGRLDVLINNAAICFNDPTLYGKVPHTPFEQQADISIRTNFFGTLQVTQTMLPLLQQSDYPPRIINIASAAGRLAILKNNQDLVEAFTSPKLQLTELESLLQQFVQDVEAGVHASKGWPNTCYGMSKLGIIAMTKLMARDYVDSIMINSVDPGFCATDQNNNQGVLPAERGAVTPYLLATITRDKFVTGKHFFQEQEIEW